MLCPRQPCAVGIGLWVHLMNYELWITVHVYIWITILWYIYIYIYCIMSYCIISSHLKTYAMYHWSLIILNSINSLNRNALARTGRAAPPVTMRRPYNMN
jgi:hypothetical protein